MIRELADYEKEMSKVEATEASLLRTLIFAETASNNESEFSATGYAKTLILRTNDDAVAGMAMYFNNYSTWRSKPGVYLEDLFVRPQYRKRGYGKMLIQALAKEVLRIEGGRLEWSCLKWNEPSLAFYKSLGAVQMEDWVQLRVDGEALQKLAAGEKTG